MEFHQVTKRFRLQESGSLTRFLPDLLRGSAWSEPFYALDNASFLVGPGEVFGIIGHNGSGKSTVLKLIAGAMAPTSGEILVRGRVCPLIELGTGFHPDLTGRENVFLNASILGMREKDATDRFGDIVDFAELWQFINTPVKKYSSGMFLRLAFSVAVHCNPDILLVDEALAVGDYAFQQKCLRRMEQFPKQGTSVVLVTHNEALLRAFCDRAMVLSHGQVLAIGDPGEMLESYRANMEVSTYLT